MALRLIGEKKMARQSETIDVVELTPNEVVQKLNDATNAVTRADSIDAQTLYAISGVAPEIRDSLFDLSDADRKIIFTEPGSGDFRVVAVNRKSDGNYEFIYDDVPVT